MTKNVLFISAGPPTWGSSRMRCWWPAKYMETGDVVVWNFPNEIEISGDYDVYIFQKYGNPNVQATLMEEGKQVWLDQCDPMWWFTNQELMRAMFDNSTGAVFSNEPLMFDFMEWYGDKGYNAYTIPDRLDMSHFIKKKAHHWITPVRFIWYGVAQNRVALNSVWANMSRLATMGHNVTLTIFDDRPDIQVTEQDDIPVLYATWDLSKENAMIAGHDIALIPPYPGSWGKVKSNNKRLTANACGLPVTDGQDFRELVRLVSSHEERQTTADFQALALERYEVQDSAREWERLLNDD